jgi:hypothetical protein
MTFSVISSRLSAAVAPAGTFTAAYPSGKDAGSFYLAMGHKLTINGAELFFPVDFDVTLGASSITVTNKTSASTWPASADYRLQMEEMGDRSQITVPMQAPNPLTETISGSSQSINVRSKLVPSVTQVYCDLVNLGAPIALDADGICASQNVTGAGNFTINGALASAGAVTLDVPRAVQVVSGGADTAVMTVSGTDVYGRSLTEAITLNGTTAVVGKKAFKTISSVANSATTSNGVTVGTTDILGLPLFLPDIGFVVGELMNGKPVGQANSVQVPFVYGQTDLLAPNGIELISPVDGIIKRATAIVQTAITTGGNIQVQVGTTAVVGLTLVFADGATAGTIVSDTPTTPGSATTLVTKGGRMRVLADASFATAGAVNGFVEVQGTDGAIVAGIRTAGGSTTTTGDVRGTYKPSVACDGANVYQLLVAYADRYAGIAQNVSGA